MARLIPMTEAFSQYKSTEEIEKAYPGIFDPQRYHQHVRVGDDGVWLVPDNYKADRHLTADEMRAMFAKGEK